MVTLVRVCHQVRGTGLALLSFTISPIHPLLSPLPRRAWWLPSGAEPYVVTQENCENPSAKVQIPQPFREEKVRTKTEQLGEGHKSSTSPANQGAREPAAKPLDIPALVGHTMRKVQRLNVCGRKLKI